MLASSDCEGSSAKLETRSSGVSASTSTSTCPVGISNGISSTVAVSPCCSAGASVVRFALGMFRTITAARMPLTSPNTSVGATAGAAGHGLSPIAQAWGCAGADGTAVSASSWVKHAQSQVYPEPGLWIVVLPMPVSKKPLKPTPS
eukprot:369561-Rhodomonas_salina.2